MFLILALAPASGVDFAISASPVITGSDANISARHSNIATVNGTIIDLVATVIGTIVATLYLFLGMQLQRAEHSRH